ncbi:hypothetical protein BY458DRAFT_154052 [Sporodiniella umbellata]|nr:hypothetical protein BY458DRAFT_154052 [Sporodiniella umbellata]
MAVHQRKRFIRKKKEALKIHGAKKLSSYFIRRVNQRTKQRRLLWFSFFFLLNTSVLFMSKGSAMALVQPFKKSLFFLCKAKRFVCLFFNHSRIHIGQFPVFCLFFFFFLKKSILLLNKQRALNVFLAKLSYSNAFFEWAGKTLN